MAEDRRPRAIFMAFGTRGDVFPIAAIAAAFACDQQQYHVVLITHLAHQSLSEHLAAKNVAYIPVSSPPVLSVHQFGSEQIPFSMHKKRIQVEHRQQCLSVVERVLGDSPSTKDDFIVINFFALEGWHLAEMFQIRCVIASPYVVPYSAPSSFERRFKQELPCLYKYFQESSPNMVNWKDVVHWMWPIFTEDWGRWRSEYLKLSPVPFMDPVTNLPAWHMHVDSPILLYGFSKEIVEYPGYWPPNIHVCGFWFLPLEWQFSCNKCRDIMSASPNGSMTGMSELCTIHADIQQFLMKSSHPQLPLFIGLSSIGRREGSASLFPNSHFSIKNCGVTLLLQMHHAIAKIFFFIYAIHFANNPPLSVSLLITEGFCLFHSMGFLKNPHAFLRVLKAVLDVTEHRFILFSSGYEPLEAAIQSIACESSNRANPPPSNVHGTFLFSDRLYCFSGSIPYSWLFSKCAVAIHHGGSGSTAAALHAGIPQILCPFILDQFYWAERLHWIGVAPEPLRSWHLFPDNDDATSISQAADCLARAIKLSLSPEIKAQASKVADRISSEDGSQEALKVLKEKVVCPC
ncbi:unnamed protein product [Musa textilis]